MLATSSSPNPNVSHQSQHEPGHYRSNPDAVGIKRQAHRVEGKSLARATSLIFSSRWAADSARRDYRVSRGKIFEQPFGPNIPDDLINQIYSPKSIGPEVKILFVSADWDRKNDDMVISVCRRMAE
jgi:hypothetical protein